MRSSLSLQRSLYAHQKRQLGALVQSASPAFKAYEQRYHRATRRYRKAIEVAEVAERVCKADVVYVGDYHTLRLAQQAYLELIKRAKGSGRRVVLALEFIEGKSQAHLDAYLAGRLSEQTFLKRIGHPYRGEFDIWPSFRAILAYAREQQLEVVAIDRRASGARSLEIRDRFAASRIAREVKADDRPLVMVLMGQFHIAPQHLPRRVERALGRVERRHFIVYQNAENLWWKLARAGETSVRAVEVDDSAVCLMSASPVVCQRSFLDYVEAEAGDAPLDETGLERTFSVMVRDIARLVGLKGLRVEGVQIITAAHFDVLRTIVKRGRFSPSDVRDLERHVLSRESAFIPRAKTVWLASLSLNHAAEEAAHAVRYACIGEAMTQSRPRGDAFWARVYEEALGFFGSRLVNPARQCTTLEGWASLFGASDSEHHQTAAFVLALHAALTEAPDETTGLVPPGFELFNSTSHALGYLLGAGLFAAFEAGRVDRKTLRALFADPLIEPVRACASLYALVSTRKRSESSRLLSSAAS